MLSKSVNEVKIIADFYEFVSRKCLRHTEYLLFLCHINKPMSNKMPKSIPTAYFLEEKPITQELKTVGSHRKKGMQEFLSLMVTAVT